MDGHHAVPASVNGWTPGCVCLCEWMDPTLHPHLAVLDSLHGVHTAALCHGSAMGPVGSSSEYCLFHTPLMHRSVACHMAHAPVPQHVPSRHRTLCSQRVCRQAQFDQGMDPLLTVLRVREKERNMTASLPHDPPPKDPDKYTEISLCMCNCPSCVNLLHFPRSGTLQKSWISSTLLQAPSAHITLTFPSYAQTQAHLSTIGASFTIIRTLPSLYYYTCVLQRPPALSTLPPCLSLGPFHLTRAPLHIPPVSLALCHHITPPPCPFHLTRAPSSWSIGHRMDACMPLV